MSLGPEVSQSTLEKAFLLFQASMTPVTKKGKNPHFKSTYTKYEDVVASVLPNLTEVGLSFRHTSRFGDGVWYLGTKLIHAESGSHSEVFEMPCPIGKMQDMGSAITYAKRYTLMALLGLPSEDDDGHKGNQPVRQAASEPKPSKAELQNLFKLMVEKSWDPQEVKAVMAKAFGYETTDKLTMKDYIALYKTIETRSPEQALEEIL